MPESRAAAFGVLPNLFLRERLVEAFWQGLAGLADARQIAMILVHALMDRVLDHYLGEAGDGSAGAANSSRMEACSARPMRSASLFSVRVPMGPFLPALGAGYRVF